MDLDRLYALAHHPAYKNEEIGPHFYGYPVPDSIAPTDVQINASWAFAPLPAYARGVTRERLFRYGPFWCTISPESHVGPFKHAIDFLAPEGTEVLAVCDGVVCAIKEDSNKWGASPKFRDHVNYLDITWTEEGSCRHEARRRYFAEYCHLARSSVNEHGLRIGSQVRRGQPIARLGKSGWMDRDHLHFLVYKRVDDGLCGFVSLRPIFPGRILS